jgi:hypothetical protein
MDATLTIVITYSKTAFIWINWDGKPFGYAKKSG